MPRAYIALGSNLSSTAGPPDATLSAAAASLASLGRITARSSLYSTAPIGLVDQPRFVNAALALETELAPRTLLSALLDIEQEFGRDRAASIPNGPRTLDLDILLYGDLVLGEAGLDIPHPRLGQRAFVLVPLIEIAPQGTDPRSRLTFAELLTQLSAKGDHDSRSVVPAVSALWVA